MRSIIVLSNFNPSSEKVDYTPLIIEQSSAALVSLISGLNTKEFGFDTIYTTAKKIEKLAQRYTKPAGKPLFIDSGGYSIIKGDVAVNDTGKAIDCYHQYLEHQHNVFDSIFSLDIPINLKRPQFNTYENIETCNRKSLTMSKQLLEQNPALADKFYFIYHFKTKEHYEIWDRLYDELELKKIIKNWAIGGMVGMKKLIKSPLSLFTGITFRCLYDYLNSLNPNPVFKLHFLGIYQRDFRFQIAFMEKLFLSYFNGSRSTCFTYDSVNYVRQSQMLNRHLEVFDFDSGNFQQHTIDNVPAELINKIYNQDIYRNGFYSELTRINNDEKLENTNVFAPLNINSNVSIDRLFEYVIDTENMIDRFSNASSVDDVKKEFQKIFKPLKKRYSQVFKPTIVNLIINNLQMLFPCHKWYQNSRDYQSLNNLIDGFIKVINLKDAIKKK